MSKQKLTENIASRIATLIFKGYGSKVKKAVRTNRELAAAVKDISDALERFDNLVEKEKKLRGR